MKYFTVAFIADYFIGWTGGATILASMFNAVTTAAASRGGGVHLLISNKYLPEHLRPADGAPIRAPSTIQASGPLQALLECARLKEIIFYGDLERAVRDLGISVIGPSGIDLGEKFPIPWFSYIPDFQHQYLHDLFSQSERIARDRIYRCLLENSVGVYVNSGTVASDVERFYHGAARSKKILRIPSLVATLPRHGDVDSVLELYGLQSQYFISCGQRWIHKRHDVIIKAFNDFSRKNPDRNMELVFTGETTDYRDPGYSESIDSLIKDSEFSDRIRVLGIVPRVNQLALIERSIGLVHASLFEGGPGASGALEAAMLGTPILASDIGPNRELTIGTSYFFDTLSTAALCNLMERVSVSARSRTDSTPALYSPSETAAIELTAGLIMLESFRGAVT